MNICNKIKRETSWFYMWPIFYVYCVKNTILLRMKHGVLQVAMRVGNSWAVRSSVGFSQPLLHCLSRSRSSADESHEHRNGKDTLEIRKTDIFKHSCHSE
jgi:hypothetical protein